MTATEAAQSFPIRTTNHLQAREVTSIQYLRGIAAMMVVFAHSNEQFMATGLHRAWRDIGWSGVDVFFVVSGFVMTYTVATHNYDWKKFLLRRIARIVPMYWALTLTTAALVIFAPWIFQTTHFSMSYFIQSLIFWPTQDPVNGRLEPLLHLGWTVNYEMFFYFIFASLLFLSPWRRCLALFSIFLLFIIVADALHSTFAPLTLWGNPVTLEFLFGCVIAVDYLGGGTTKIPVGTPIAVFALGVSFLVVGGLFDDSLSNRWILRGAPAALTIWSIVAIERVAPIRIEWLHRLGDATYSIYLTHIFVVLPIHKLWLRAHLPTTGPAVYGFVLICILSAAFVGIAAYLLIEKKLTQYAKRALGV